MGKAWTPDRSPDWELEVLTAPPLVSTGWNIGNSKTIFKKPKVSLMFRNARIYVQLYLLDYFSKKKKLWIVVS